MNDTENKYDKDVAKTIAYMCKADEMLNDIGKVAKEFTLIVLGEGEWQCVFGNHFTGSLTYDSKLITFVDF